MALDLPEGFGQAVVRFQCAGVIDTMVVTFGYDCDPGPAIGSPDINAGAIMTLLTGSTGKLLHSASTFSSYTVLGVSVTEQHGGAPFLGVSSGGPSIGVATGEALPPNCAFLVKKGTNLGGRKGRGRMYFPPLFYAEGNVTTAGVVVGSMTTIQGRLNTFLSDLAAAGIPMVLLHKKKDGVIPAPTLVTTLTLQPLLATQRRRMR